MDSSARIDLLLGRLREPRTLPEPDDTLLEIAAYLQAQATESLGVMHRAMENLSEAAEQERNALLEYVRGADPSAVAEMFATITKRSSQREPTQREPTPKDTVLTNFAQTEAAICRLRDLLRITFPSLFEHHASVRSHQDGPVVAVVDAALGLLQLHLTERRLSFDLSDMAWADEPPPMPHDVDDTIRFLYDAELSDSQTAKVVARAHPHLVEQARNRFLDNEGPLDEQGRPWTHEALEKIVAKRIENNVTRRRKNLGLRKDADGRPIRDE